MELSKLCGGDLDAPIKVSVFDYESKGGHVAMGSFETSVNGIVNGSDSKQEFTLVQKGKNVGTISVLQASVSGVSDDIAKTMAATSISTTPSSDYSFVDYVSGGCELNVMVAIDFTGSNGDPRKPGTLHYLHRGEPMVRNDYEKVRIMNRLSCFLLFIAFIQFSLDSFRKPGHCIDCEYFEQVRQ